jgi:hypothetical protein
VLRSAHDDRRTTIERTTIERALICTRRVAAHLIGVREFYGVR